MKKIIALLMATLMVFALAACGKKPADTTDGNGTNEVQNNEENNGAENNEAENNTEENADNAVSTEGAAGVLSSIWNTFADDQKFSVGGGDTNNMVTDAPGKYDITLTEDMDASLGLPPEQAANIDDAASLMHMMNANLFTGAAYHLKEGTDAAEFANAFKTHLADRQWLCGRPEIIMAIEYDGYVITAFGSKENTDNFKAGALTLEGAKVLFEEEVTE